MPPSGSNLHTAQILFPHSHIPTSSTPNHIHKIAIKLPSQEGLSHHPHHPHPSLPCPAKPQKIPQSIIPHIITSLQAANHLTAICFVILSPQSKSSVFSATPYPPHPPQGPIYHSQTDRRSTSQSGTLAQRHRPIKRKADPAESETWPKSEASTECCSG